MRNALLLLLLSSCASDCRCSSNMAAHDGLVAPPLDVPGAPPLDVPGAPPDVSGHVIGDFAVGIVTGLSSNCTSDGAAIDTVRMSLVDASGACLPTTFHLMRDKTHQIVEASSTCPPGTALLPCFDLPSFVSVIGVSPGGYHLRVDGLTAVGACWKGDASIGVVQGTPDEQSLTLLKQPSCP